MGSNVCGGGSDARGVRGWLGGTLLQAPHGSHDLLGFPARRRRRRRDRMWHFHQGVGGASLLTCVPSVGVGV